MAERQQRGPEAEGQRIELEESREREAARKS
jgi:hypothetical protein